MELTKVLKLWASYIGIHKTECVIGLSALFMFFWYKRKSKIRQIESRCPVKPDSKYEGNEMKHFEMPFPVIHGWVATSFTRYIQSTSFGPWIVQKLKRKTKLDVFENVYFPEQQPTFYPIVPPETWLMERESITSDKLWELTCDENDTKKDVGFEFLSLSQLIKLYRNQILTPEDIASAVVQNLDLAEKSKPLLKAFVGYSPTDIMLQAANSTRRWEMGKPLSILDGVPVGVKDEFFVTGYKCLNGVGMDKKPSIINDEKGLVKKLRDGGAIIVGITNMHQIGLGVFGINQSRYHGCGRNPYNMNFTPGGSSGGSAAAVASGLCVFALGTDGGGSIRIPSAVCGVVGLKATYTRYSIAGCFTNASTVSHTGAICSSVDDMALVYGYLAGEDFELPIGFSQPPVLLGDFRNQDLKGMKLGIDRQLLGEANSAIRDGCEKASAWLEDLHGMEITEVHLPENEEMFRALVITILSEMARSNMKLFHQYNEYVNVDTNASLMLGGSFTAVDYIQAAIQRTRSINAMKYLFSKVDCILIPATNDFQPRLDASIVNNGYINNSLTGNGFVKPNALGNLTGIPCISIPVDYTKDNLPVSVQLIAPWWREDILLRVAGCVERHLRKRKPDVHYSMLAR